MAKSVKIIVPSILPASEPVRLKVLSALSPSKISKPAPPPPSPVKASMLLNVPPRMPPLIALFCRSTVLTPVTALISILSFVVSAAPLIEPLKLPAAAKTNASSAVPPCRSLISVNVMAPPISPSSTLVMVQVLLLFAPISVSSVLSPMKLSMLLKPLAAPPLTLVAELLARSIVMGRTTSP